MPASFAPFITPFASPAMGRIDTSALIEVGQNLSRQAFAERQREDALAAQAKRYELDKQETEGRNRYYDMQAETHRLQVQQAKDAATQKRVNALFDAFRKAKTPIERQAIRDELKRVGYSVEEAETELPGEPGEPVATPGVKPPPVSYVQMPKTSGFRTPVSTDVQSEMVPIPATGVLPTAQAGPPAPAKPARGGRFVIRDPSGIQVAAYDEPLERMKSQTTIRAALGSIGLAAVTEREKLATQAATEAGAQMLDLGVSPHQALQHSIQIYDKTLTQEHRRTYPPVTPGKPGTGPRPVGKEERMRRGALSDDVSKIIDQVGRDKKVQEVNKAGLHINRGLELLKGERSGFRDTQAMAQLLREMSGLAVTEQEYSRTVGGEGLMKLLEQKVSFYVGSGKLPDETIRELKEVFLRANSVYKQSLKDMGDIAYEQAKRRLLTATEEEREEQADAARGYFTGQYLYGGKKEPAKGTPKAQTAPAADSDEELVRKWKAGRK